jgi:nitroreductase
MADNYLGNKMEEYMERKAAGSPARKPQATLARLLLRNRSHRGFDTSFRVREDQLRRIIEVNRRTPSARNAQVLRFRPVLADEAYKVLPHIRLGGALPELHLPTEGSEPNAFIVICSTVPESKWVDVDLGIAAQSMLLQAVEIGLNGVCIGAFDKEKIAESLGLELEPLLILAIGRGTDRIEMVDIDEGDSHAYYRENGVHYVPKFRLEERIL